MERVVNNQSGFWLGKLGLVGQNEQVFYLGEVASFIPFTFLVIFVAQP